VDHKSSISKKAPSITKRQMNFSHSRSKNS
jgi:hypothetical protein